MIPKHCTPLVQPLDVYYNRPFKNFYRSLVEKVKRTRPDVIVSTRVNCAKLLSLAHNQFANARFDDLRLYAWKAAGLLEVETNTFRTPMQYCFIDNLLEKCALCAEKSLIRCSHCEDHLCYYHFVDEYHLHYD